MGFARSLNFFSQGPGASRLYPHHYVFKSVRLSTLVDCILRKYGQFSVCADGSTLMSRRWMVSHMKRYVRFTPEGERMGTARQLIAWLMSILVFSIFVMGQGVRGPRRPSRSPWHSLHFKFSRTSCTVTAIKVTAAQSRFVHCVKRREHRGLRRHAWSPRHFSSIESCVPTFLSRTRGGRVCEEGKDHGSLHDTQFWILVLGASVLPHEV